METKTFKLAVLSYSSEGSVTIYERLELSKTAEQDWSDVVEEFLIDEEYSMNNINYIFDENLEIEFK